jgi:hypothetical protein
VPNGVHARMDPVQAPSPKPHFDPFLCKSKPRELPPPHHPVLPPREHGDVTVIPASPRKPLLNKG